MATTEGSLVRVHYCGTLEDGSEFDSSAGRDPLEFTLGAGQVIPGFDAAVAGLDLGESVTVTIATEDAYGEHVEAAVHKVQADAFPSEPVVGGIAEVGTPDGRTMNARITSIVDGEVTLDFNHPLAGQALTFEIELVEIVEPDAVEPETDTPEA
mgnify:CR=1 FL=1